MPKFSRDDARPRPRLTLAAAMFAIGAACVLPGFAQPASASQLEQLAMTEEFPDAESAAPELEKLTAAPESRALAERFDAHGYDWQSVLAGDAQVPELSVRKLPTDLVHLRDLDLKKSLFFRALLPAILQVNRDVETDRARLLDLKAVRASGAELEPLDRAWLIAIAEDYGGDADNLDDLLLRVNTVPPSLVLAQAAEESGWGTSRFVREGNALFGEYTWNEGYDGIIPADNAGDVNRRVRVFESVRGAVASYVHNLNTHSAYKRFRMRRAAGASGYELAASLKSYSERGEDYVDTIRVIIRVNRLSTVDHAELAEEVQVSRNP